MDIQPRRGIPAAPNSCRIIGTVVELILNEKSLNQILKISIGSIIEGRSPFIQDNSSALATTDISAQLASGDQFEAKAEYVGDEWGGKIHLSEIKITDHKTKVK